MECRDRLSVRVELRCSGAMYGPESWMLSRQNSAGSRGSAQFVGNGCVYLREEPEI